MNYIGTIKLIIDNDTLSEYEKYYFKLHPRATKKPIENPYHPPMNQWMIMKRPMMNTLKQKWKDFICYYIDKLGYSNLRIKKCDMKFVTYYKTNGRHDVDAACPKFILDGFVASGFIAIDENKHVTSLLLECHADKENPRTEITIKL